ncbi:MAG: V-type ATP synthase subunit D [Erysipelotrichaceae bacterium]|nr:V-type ATP synthase subunit D [Erysipelotrichaceae bacterium]MDD3924953.1 V-type ATP synthase subunit D [Erysipelotrichaceae bacterium]MDD4643387.1 V-type ATP synthase subunit D [Erysipelotrichaceae bacterium]
MSDSKVFPTKGNLLKAKKSLELAKVGYDLLDRKRNVLIREMMLLMDKVKILRNEITDSYSLGYYLLQQANISTGVINDIATSVTVDDSIKVTYRSVMGVELPSVSFNKTTPRLEYGFKESNSRVDEAYIQFHKIKELTILLAEVDNSVYRLASAIRKTQKRANALKNIVIPNLENTIKFIAEAMEEKEREEFSRLKIIKANKQQENTI